MKTTPPWDNMGKMVLSQKVWGLWNILGGCNHYTPQNNKLWNLNGDNFEMCFLAVLKMVLVVLLSFDLQRKLVRRCGATLVGNYSNEQTYFVDRKSYREWRICNSAIISIRHFQVRKSIFVYSSSTDSWEIGNGFPQDLFPFNRVVFHFHDYGRKVE